MPTGYTADLYEGKDVTFPDFALRCARAFGALIDLRDEPLDAPLPDLSAGCSYHHDAHAKARARLAEIEAMNRDQLRAAADREYVEELRAHRAGEAKRVALRARYDAMLEQVLAWTPPTEEHGGLQAFMVAQLEESISWDTSVELPRPVKRSDEEWRAAAFERALYDLEYHARRAAAEEEQAAGRVAWLRALRESLTAGTSPEGAHLRNVASCARTKGSLSDA